MSFGAKNTFDECIHAVRESRAVLSDGAVNEAQVLEQHELPVLVQPVERFVPRVFLKGIGDFSDVILCYRSGGGDAFKMIK